MSENLSGILWRSKVPNVSKISIKEERKLEADTKSESSVFQRESSEFSISGTFQKAEAGTAQNTPLFKRSTYRFRDAYRFTIPCSLCHQELRPSEFFAHKRQHKAMTVMGFKMTAGEKTERQKVITQRHFLISTLIEAYLYNEKTRQNIDNACELLCMQHIPSYYKILSNSFNSSVHLRKTKNPLVNAVAICEDQNKSWRSVMEDRYTFQGRYGKKSNVCFFGLFDGHHGSVAAETTAVELPKFFLDQLAQYDYSYKLTKREQRFVHSFDTVFKEAYRRQEYLFSSQKRKISASSCDYEWIHRAFAKAFWRMDRVLKLGRKEVSNFYWSGCSAVACLLEFEDDFGSNTTSQTLNLTEDSEKEMEEEKGFQLSKQLESNFGVLHIANVGNVHVVLCKGGQAYLLTKEHTTRSLSERHRVLKEGGKISSNEPNGYTEGLVQITRGLGFHGNPNLRKSVIPVPQTISVPIDDTCQFLIVATTGLWDVIDKNEAAAIVMSLFSIYEEIYKTTKREMHRPLLHRVPFFPSISSSTISVQDSKIKLLYHNTSAFLQKMSQQSTNENSQVNSKNGSSPTLERLDKHKDSKSMLNSKTEISSSRPFYLYGIEDSDETNSSTSHESSNSSIADEEINRNFFDYAAEYVSHGLVKAALTAGSRENITVLVTILNGCGYQLCGSEIGSTFSSGSQKHVP
ncbi:protein phosphatase 2C-like domain-containing protein 1 [Vombatus ursinus]|uniref:protein phosphatase 2C-like domain-containing protein 1 n=1 Tax=Vombatus ursinus TaxID=29139 RepID=UPI000FFD08A6|nr:protein phosphatase 2C-like domain-containing protein 1 [Vombatus ursinus]